MSEAIVRVETPRLRIVPLTAEDLARFKEAGTFPGISDGGDPEERAWDERFLKVVGFKLLKIYERPAELLWWTYWDVVRRVDEQLVGRLGFKGPPGERGEVEVGYLTLLSERRRGYMTEAVAAMLDWAFGHPDVKAVTATTPAENVVSHRVLVKCGFGVWLEQDGRMFWRLERTHNAAPVTDQTRKGEDDT